MTRFASVFVSNRLVAAAAIAATLLMAQFGLASCEPDEFAPVATRVAH